MKKVLVIEDNADNLMLISYVLRHAGYEVILASTGEEGIAIALSEKPYFIIMDVGLPNMDGIEATKKIRSSEIGKTIPIIAMTAYAMAGDKEMIINSGCNGYIEKPIDPITVMDMIHEMIK